MSDYLSHIASRSSGITPRNALTPQTGSNYAQSPLANGIVEESNNTFAQARPQETTTSYQNAFEKSTASIIPTQSPIVGASISKGKNLVESTPPQYFNKIMARAAVDNTEKSVFKNTVDKAYQKTADKMEDEGFWSDNTTPVQQEQNAYKPSASFVPQKDGKSLTKASEIQGIDEQTTRLREQKKPILTQNTEGGIQFLKNASEQTEIRKADSFEKNKALTAILQPNKTANERTQLQPTALNGITPPIKKAASSPKLVVGRITVQVLPPVAPMVKTIVRTEQRDGSSAATSNNTVHKLSFGLGQL